MSVNTQPVSNVEWVDVNAVQANAWNPNRVFPPEMALLKLSILEDGWTQPLVVQPHGDGTFELVDGYHRWTLAHDDPDVHRVTGGQVPVVRITADAVHARASTVRHNRARGSHYVVRMADLVHELADELDQDWGEIGRRLGMDAEEVERLYDRGAMTKRRAAAVQGRAWRPAPQETSDKGAWRGMDVTDGDALASGSGMGDDVVQEEADHTGLR